MAAQPLDRRGEDVGNIVVLEHVNVRMPDQQRATLFYVLGLGLTRDPYLMVGTDNMWINVGQQQFHLPTNRAQVLRGVVGLVVPSVEALAARLERVKDRLADTAFAYTVGDRHIDVTCPWGNRLRCHAPGPDFGHMTLGVPYVEFRVATGHAEGIARFYERVFEAVAHVTPDGSATVARVRVGPNQQIVFRETRDALADYDGHHVAIYVSRFSPAHAFLHERGLVTEDTNPHQYRFNWIVDPESGARLFEVEHEVRSLTHPMYMRPLVNRNPGQTQRAYVRGRDAYFPGAA